MTHFCHPLSDYQQQELTETASHFVCNESLSTIILQILKPVHPQ